VVVALGEVWSRIELFFLRLEVVDFCSRATLRLEPFVEALVSSVSCALCVMSS